MGASPFSPRPWYHGSMQNRSRTTKPPRDFNSHAFQSVAILTETAPPPPESTEPEKDPAAVALGRKGGLKGGKARAAKMSPEERTESARKAAKARWGS
jgi:hypothetical protein